MRILAIVIYMLVSKIARKYIRIFYLVSLFYLYCVLSIFGPLRAISTSFSIAFVLSILYIWRTTAELKLGGIALKRSIC